MMKHVLAGLLVLLTLPVAAVAQVQPAAPIASKGYVDTQLGTKLPKSGGALTGGLSCASGSACPLSGLTVTPSASAAIGTLERIANDKADLNDSSSVIGSAAKHWSAPYYGNPATGTEPFRRNRIFCGTATASGGGLPASPSTWPETYFGPIIATSQLACISAIGEPAITGVTRTSDFRKWAGSASGGPPGVGAFTINDDTGTGAPIATAFYGESIHAAGVTGVTEVAEFTVSSAGPTVPLTPFGGVKAGTTFSLNLTAGFRAGYLNNVSAAMLVGGSLNGTKQQRGIVVRSSALDPALGRGGLGIAMELAQGQSVRWLKSDDSVAGEIYAGANGLAIGPNQIEGAWAAYTPVLTQSDGTTVISGATTDCATIRIGRTVQLRCKIVLPASSFGDGSLFVRLPSISRSAVTWIGQSPQLSGAFRAVISAYNNIANVLDLTTSAKIGAASREFNFAGTYEANAD